MKKLLISLLLVVVAVGCKKDGQTVQKLLIGTSWESSSYPAGGEVIYNERLEFISATEVVSYTTFTADRLMTSQGRTTLSYTIDNPDADSPQVHVTGTYNSIAGSPSKGDPVNFTLTYVPPSGSANAVLNLGSSKTFTKVVYR